MMDIIYHSRRRWQVIRLGLCWFGLGYAHTTLLYQSKLGCGLHGVDH